MTANAPSSHGGHAPGFPVFLAQVQCTGLQHFIKGQVGKNHAARADILRRMNRQDEALQEYQRAIALTTNTVEQQYLRRRIDELMP